MVTPVTSQTPTPKPSVAEQAKASIDSMKSERDIFRPFRRAGTFIGGTITETLNGIAHGGRKGLWVGLGLGIVAGIASGGILVPAVLGAAGGFGIGVLAEGARGLLTGGYKALGRQMRGERYADDLIERSKVQHAAGRYRNGSREAYRRNQQLDDSIRTNMILERQNEINNDYNTYWRDQVNQSNGQGKGVGY